MSRRDETLKGLITSRNILTYDVLCEFAALIGAEPPTEASVSSFFVKSENKPTKDHKAEEEIKSPDQVVTQHLVGRRLKKNESST